ncbi:homeobox protein vab-15-like [Montipora capricornis]|uniref:homeobox protein vab-15-like n=1 Tax=Montipora capricornis TaxID=246305 RepID=UPI0035F11010
MAKQVTDLGVEESQSLSSQRKPYLAFSIDSILGKDRDENVLEQRPSQREEKMDTRESIEEKASMEATLKNFVDLPWLSYTRYSPPKLPRSRKKVKNCKRRLSGSPRVPFSSTQLQALEEAYMVSRYLSVAQVEELSTSLQLPHHRIKIWFQNRRAREKRIQDEPPIKGKRVLLPQPRKRDGYDYDTPCFVPFFLKGRFHLNSHSSETPISHPGSLKRSVYTGLYLCERVFF